jgi:transketolase
MRKEFCAWLESYAAAHQEVVFLTNDVGFQALEGVAARIGQRFVNAGVSEQNMVSVAAGLASEGLTAFCYGIAPFAVFRPAEQIRLDVCLHHLEVKMVGNGGGYGYGIMGGTHHALEDLAMLSAFQGMNCFIPVTGADVPATCEAMMRTKGPGYLRLNFGNLPAGYALSASFAPIRRVTGPGGAPPAPKVTVVALGPIVLNALAAQVPEGSADFFAVAQLPLPELSPELVQSVEKTGRLLVLEEHVEKGGLAEHLALALLRRRLAPRLATRAARGYPSGKYGSQAWHQKESGLDAASLGALIQELAAS